mmetsp:Transcript_2374/g.5387  ORF Transcript_2374/g.5387 Transcript_2374/m.5387 type:complete len:229 (-) Transcript_2374:762-1448(-)
MESITVEGPLLPLFGGFADITLKPLLQADLPIIDVAHFETNFTIGEVVMPLTNEFVIEALAEGADLCSDVFLMSSKSSSPLMQCLRIVEANREGRRGLHQSRPSLLAGTLNLFQAHQIGARKDPLSDEVGSNSIGLVAGVRHANRLNGGLPSRLQALVYGSKVSWKVFVTNGLDHLTADNFGECPGAKLRCCIPVVAENDLDAVAEPCGCDALLSQRQLFLGQCDGRP